MLSGGNPASVMVSRNGPFRLFQVGTLRPSLSLPSPVSTTIRREGVSTTSEWIDILRRHSSVAKWGMSQGNFRISSLPANGRMNRVLPVVSNSTIFVILTLPTFQCIRRFPQAFSAFSFLAAKDAGFRSLAQWIILRGRALSGSPKRGGRDAGTSDFSRKSRIFDRESARIRCQGCGVRSERRVQRGRRRYDRCAGG